MNNVINKNIEIAQGFYQEIINHYNQIKELESKLKNISSDIVSMANNADIDLDKLMK